MDCPRRFPPEWAEQAAVLLAWPDDSGAFRPWLAEVESTYCRIAEAIAARQPLLILCRDRAHRQRIQCLLFGRRAELRRVSLIEMAYDDVWVRDTAPLTVEGADGAVLLDFRFNGWGGKYPHAADAALAGRLHATRLFPEAPLQALPMVLEGGSVESDGAGSLLTTTRCLLNPNRNPGLSKSDIEAQLREQFGASRVLWLEHGHTEGDDTDAHVDTLARFCDPATIAYTASTDAADPLHADLEAMARELRQFRTAEGQPYRLVALPLPRPIRDEDGQRLPATYANFLIINGAALVPVYGDDADCVALERLAACFPGRTLVPIEATPLIRQYGSIHCMTMHFPHSVALELNHG